jgi:hypothetical protein
LVLLSASQGFAQPPPTDRAAAESLFQDGRRLLEAGETATACLKFAESQRLAPALGTLLNLAACHEREGKTASAWVEFTEATTLSERAGESARAAYAAERARALSAVLAHVTIAVSTRHDGLHVTLDGRDVGAGMFGTAIAVDPGEHRIHATAPGRRAWQHSFLVRAGPSRVTVEIPELVPEAGPTAETGPAPSLQPKRAPKAEVVAGAPSRQSAPAPRASTTRLPLLIATGTVAVAGIGLGTWFGLRTFAEKRVADRECPNTRCSSSLGIAANERAHDAALVSTLAFGAGALSAGLFSYLLWDGASSKVTRWGFQLAPVAAEGAYVLGHTEF